MCKKLKIKSHGISRDFIEKSRDLQVTKIPGSLFRDISEIKILGFLVQGFFNPGIIPEYPGTGISRAHLYSVASKVVKAI